jgi:hypothetical protein
MLLACLGLVDFGFRLHKKTRTSIFNVELWVQHSPPEEGGWGGVKATKGYVNDFGQEGQFFQKVVAMLNQKSSAKHWGEPAHFSGESVRAV